MTTRPRVVISEDDPVLVGLLRRILEPQLEVVGTVATAQATVEVVSSEQPDALLLDVMLGGDSGLDVLPQLVLAAPRTMVAAMTGLDPLEWEDRLLRAGAFVYYEKTVLLELPALIDNDLTLFRRALAGEDVLAPSALRRRRRIDTDSLRAVVDPDSQPDRGLGADGVSGASRRSAGEEPAQG
jgi:DNA-binding response OmpR family regulator